LTKEEIDLIVSTIDLRDRSVENIMINISDVFMISDKEKVSKELIQRILAKGFSKIPVYQFNNKNIIVGKKNI
jgi:metal transporter CNNM